jgi:hypothetical protein
MNYLTWRREKFKCSHLIVKHIIYLHHEQASLTVKTKLSSQSEVNANVDIKIYVKNSSLGSREI